MGRDWDGVSLTHLRETDRLWEATTANLEFKGRFFSRLVSGWSQHRIFSFAGSRPGDVVLDSTDRWYGAEDCGRILLWARLLVSGWPVHGRLGPRGAEG